MVGSLAQSVITDFTCLEFCVQAGAIQKISSTLHKTENLNVIAIYISFRYYSHNSQSHCYRWIRVIMSKQKGDY